jgi:hypothetical protein
LTMWMAIAVACWTYRATWQHMRYIKTVQYAHKISVCKHEYWILNKVFSGNRLHQCEAGV